MTHTDAVGLLHALVLEDGHRWGDLAEPWQITDAAAVLDTTGPLLHFLTRPRGASKTSDLAAVALAALLEQLPPSAQAYGAAADRDQAALLIAAIGGWVRRSGLDSLVDVGTWRATSVRSGAAVTALAADGPSAYGLRPAFVIADELAAWPGHTNARQMWEALVSAVPKLRDGRLAILTTAGDPAHWSYKVLERARKSGRWRTSEVAGPTPWIDPGALDEQRHLLMPSAFARLHLNVWTAPDDRLATADDLAACVSHTGDLEPVSGVRYAVGVDIGLKRDRTVVTVAHLDGVRVVVDRVAVWRGSRLRPVDLGEVEALCVEVHSRYRGPTFLVDPYQAAQLMQRLRAKGVRAVEYAFTQQSVGRLAQRLFQLIRDHHLGLPDDVELLGELANVRLRETSPGVYRLDHDSDKHDDRAISLALAALHLTDRPVSAPGRTSARQLSRARLDVGSGLARGVRAAEVRSGFDPTGSLS